MTLKNYPQAIYMGENMFGEEVEVKEESSRRHVERVYEMGLNDSGDWHNLSKLMDSGEKISWKDLSFRRVQVIGGNGEKISWVTKDVDNFHRIFNYLANGISTLLEDWVFKNEDWTVWVEGEIVFTRKTADALVSGTKFLGRADFMKDDEEPKSLVIADGGHIFSDDLKTSYSTLPSGWEVIRVVGQVEEVDG